MHKHIYKILIFIFITSIAYCEDNFSSYDVIAKRNIFQSLWMQKQETAPTQASISVKDNSNELKLLKQQEEQRRLELQEAEARRAIESKKNSIEREYKVTGIVFENNVPQAVIQSSSGASYFVKENGRLQDLDVKKIDADKGEVELSYEDKFTVKLYMQ
jgi:hypothetical protein